MPRFFRTGQLLAVALACSLAAVARAEVAAPTVELSANAATRAQAVSPPVITAPVSVQAVHDQSLTIQADATDSDAADVLTITQTGAPAFLTFSHSPSVSPAMATLSGTPGMGDLGTYMIDWQVSDGTTTASTSTSLEVVMNGDPIVTAPATAQAAETVPFTLNVTVSDPDNDPLTSLTAAPLPTGANFSANAFKTAGVLTWTPALGQAGDYSVTFTSESGSPTRTGTATTAIHVGPRNLPPVVTITPGGAAQVNTVPNVLVTFTVTVTDPDGDAITDLQIEGTQNTALPAGATAVIAPNFSSGVFTWTPTSSQVGNVGIDIIAKSGPLGQQTIVVKRINVTPDRLPVVVAPATATGAEGSLLTINATASDPDASAPAIGSLTAAPLPLGATFSANPTNTAGTFSWTPDFTQAGVYNVTFTAMNALSGSATTQITVTNTNQAPVADAGGPYSGFAGSSVNFNGAGSSDPDGDALTYAWDFGDGGTATGPTPSHIYGLAGDYSVSLQVTDPGLLTSTDVATASIQTFLPAHVFFLGGFNYVFPQILGTWIRIESTGAFSIDDLLVQSVTMTYNGVTVPARCKGGKSGDSNHNGAQEVRVCFTKSDLKTLFASVPNGVTDVVASVQGDLSSGGKIQGNVSIHVIKFSWLGAGAMASVSPNPLNPQAKLSFVTTRPGPVTIQVFDIQGRMVRNVMPRQYLMPGLHDVTIDGRNEQGNRLSSGVYFFRVQSAEGVSKGSFQVLK